MDLQLFIVYDFLGSAILPYNQNEQYTITVSYTHLLLYFHTEIKNRSNVPFDMDYITFKVVDKKVVKRTAIQEQVLLPVRAYNYVVRVAGKKTEQTVFCLPKFTIPDDKELVVEMNEKEGGRHQDVYKRQR